MSQKSKKILLIAFFFVLVSYTAYYQYYRNKEFQNNSVSTIGITYKTLYGRTTDIRYFFKTPNGIYTGYCSAKMGKVPGYYYPVRYSLKNPTINEMNFDSLIADSIGRKFIKIEEVFKSNVINNDDVPDWQW